MADKDEKSINKRENDKDKSLKSQKPVLNCWLELIISPLTWMVTLTGIGLFSGIRLEGNGSVIMLCAFFTVGIALFRFFKINMAYLLVPVVIIFPIFLAQGGNFNLPVIGIVAVYSYIGYRLTAVLLNKKLAEKFPKENALYVAGALPIAYFLFFQLYTLIRFKEIISGMLLVGTILLVFEIGIIAIYWELLSKEKIKVLIERIPKQYRAVLIIVIVLLLVYLIFFG